MNTPLEAGPLADPTGARSAVLMLKYAAPERLLEKRASDVLTPPAIAGAYADRDRTYPIHTAAASWTSAAAYHDNQSSDPAVGNRIKEACDWFGISSEWDRLAAMRPTDPLPEPTVKWAMPHRKKYPLDNAAQVKTAIDYFNLHRSRFNDAEDRRIYAENLVKEADIYPELFGAKTLWRLEAEAGLGLPASDWTSEVNFRAKRARDCGETELADLLIKTAAQVNYGGTGNSEHSFTGGTFRNAGELADLLAKVDHRLGWGGGDPLTGLVGETPSTAKAKLAGVTKSAAGHWYRMVDLDRVPDAICSDIAGMGPIVSRTSKAQKLAQSTEFERLVQTLGIAPVEHARRGRVDWAAESAA